jgi:ABC-type multidrug transport system permease subunit
LQDYVWNKINLHIFAALFGGFTFWMIGDGSFDLQLRVFAVFNFIFVAPGCINQMQPFLCTTVTYLRLARRR